MWQSGNCDVCANILFWSIIIWTSTFFMKATVCGMNCRAIITSLVWNCPPQKKKGISAYGVSDICAISVSIKRCSTPTCLQHELIYAYVVGRWGVILTAFFEVSLLRKNEEKLYTAMLLEVGLKCSQYCFRCHMRLKSHH